MSFRKRNLIRRAAAHTRLSPYVISENSANSVTEHSLDNGVSDGLGWVGHRRIQVTIDVYGHLVPGENVAWIDTLDRSPEKVEATAANAGQGSGG